MSTHDQGAIDRVERRLDELVRLVGDVRERLSHVEGQATHAAVTELRKELEAAHARIATLEANDHIRSGHLQASKTWGEWIHRLAPWIFAVALVVWNYAKPPL